MECACALCAGEQNAADTIGWDRQGTEEFAHLAILSIESCLQDKSDGAKAAFRAFGVYY